MLEKEQSYVDKLRSELAKAGTGSSSTNITAVQAELAGAERRVRTLQDQLAAISTTNEQVRIFTLFLCIFSYILYVSSTVDTDMHHHRDIYLSQLSNTLKNLTI